MKDSSFQSSPAIGVVTLAALLIVIAPAWPVTAQDRASLRNQETQPPRVPPDWDTFTADITIRQSRVSTGDTLMQAPAASTFRFERTRSGGGWKTAITVLSGGAINAAPGTERIKSKAPQVGMRIEDPGDGSGIRMVDAAGKELRLTPRDRPRRVPGRPESPPFPSLLPAESLVAGIGNGPLNPGREWADELVIPSGQQHARARALQGLRGKPLDRAKGLDRYVTPHQDGESEILVDPESALPVEMNVVQHGTLVTHVTHEYTPYGPQRLLRKRVRVERQLPGSGGERTLTVVELDNVRFERRGGGE